MNSAPTLEPASPTLTDVHIDFHVSATGPIKHITLSSDEVKIDLGAVSMYLGGNALDRVIEELLMARRECMDLAFAIDPLPAL